jgi:hypothetical protein
MFLRATFSEFHELGPAGFAQPYFPFFKYETLPIKASDHYEKLLIII